MAHVSSNELYCGMKCCTGCSSHFHLCYAMGTRLGFLGISGHFQHNNRFEIGAGRHNTVTHRRLEIDLTPATDINHTLWR